jgi:hypothetical protein
VRFRLCKGRARRFTLAGPAFVGCRTDDGQSLPAGVSLSAASVRCVLPGPLTGPAQEIFRVLFTIEQTLPLFPASIGYARWVPTTPTGNLKWEYSMASAQILALGPFLFCAYHFVLKGHAFGIVFRKPCLRGVLVGEDLARCPVVLRERIPVLSQRTRTEPPQIKTTQDCKET